LTETLTVPPQADWPLYWFAKLEQAVEDGDHQTAAEAQRELARLGVRVAYGRPRSVAIDADAARQEASR
jgi:hypothetical protein